jgi:hypothetical protein
MYVTRSAIAAALCALATTSTALAQQPALPEAGKLPLPAAKYEGVWPKTLPQGKPAEAMAPAEWTKQDIELATARCAALLKGLDLVAVPEAPFREGTECGTPAPRKLISIGSNPQIALSPPPVLTCDMIAGLHRWLEREVQPLARKHLGAPIVRVATMSSYSCRNAYGRAKSRLSEHGRVNALDIGAFVTSRGQTAMVVADWGPIAREIDGRAAAAQKKQEAETAAAKQKNSPGAPTKPADIATQPLRPSISIDVPGVAVQIPDQSTGLGFVQQSRLGGPKQVNADPAAPTAEPLTGKNVFLRAAHQAACRIFGTVLGPEANNAHKNHFHVDMAERKHVVICE